LEPGRGSGPLLGLGSAGERIALQVDEVLGNREVVIKNLGPQLARVPGIAGATVLGTGDIVLILNPLANHWLTSVWWQRRWETTFVRRIMRDRRSRKPDRAET